VEIDRWELYGADKTGGGHLGDTRTAGGFSFQKHQSLREEGAALGEPSVINEERGQGERVRVLAGRGDTAEEPQEKFREKKGWWGREVRQGEAAPIKILSASWKANLRRPRLIEDPPRTTRRSENWSQKSPRGKPTCTKPSPSGEGGTKVFE